MPNDKALVILNCSSGFTDSSQASEEIRRVFQRHGADCRIQHTFAGTDLAALARRAIENGARYIIAGGGDGTVRAVAEAVAGTEAALGILPAGTLNHFARDLEIPLDLLPAAEAAATGVPVWVDIAEVNGRVFINNSVLGLYPAYRMEKASWEWQGWGLLSKLTGLYATIRRYPFLTARFQFEGAQVVHRTPFVMIANNEHAMEGFKPWERERLTEGRLWAYVMRDRSRLGLLRIVAKFLAGRFRASEEFDVFQAPELTIETRRRRLRVSVDGEIVRMTSPLRYRSRPRELRVVVPRDSRRVAEAAAREVAPSES